MCHPQFHVGHIRFINVDFIISLLLRQQLTLYHPVVKHQITLNHIPLLTDLPHIKGNLNHITLFFFFNH